MTDTHENDLYRARGSKEDYEMRARCSPDPQARSEYMALALQQAKIEALLIEREQPGKVTVEGQHIVLVDGLLMHPATTEEEA